KENSEKDIDDFNNVEYLPAIDTTGLLKKVKKKDASLKLLQIKYDSAKDFQTGDNYSQSAQQTTPTHNCADDNDDDFFQKLECKELG
ncbi:3038_t:CDS:2, partial [Dentiscutata heterogama]